MHMDVTETSGDEEVQGFGENAEDHEDPDEFKLTIEHVAFTDNSTVSPVNNHIIGNEGAESLVNDVTNFDKPKSFDRVLPRNPVKSTFKGDREMNSTISPVNNHGIGNEGTKSLVNDVTNFGKPTIIDRVHPSNPVKSTSIDDEKMNSTVSPVNIHSRPNENTQGQVNNATNIDNPTDFDNVLSHNSVKSIPIGNEKINSTMSPVKVHSRPNENTQGQVNNATNFDNSTNFDNVLSHNSGKSISAGDKKKNSTVSPVNNHSSGKEGDLDNDVDNRPHIDIGFARNSIEEDNENICENNSNASEHCIENNVSRKTHNISADYMSENIGNDMLDLYNSIIPNHSNNNSRNSNGSNFTNNSTNSIDNDRKDGNSTLSKVFHQTHESNSNNSVNNDQKNGNSTLSKVLHQIQEGNSNNSINNDQKDGNITLSKVFHQTQEGNSNNTINNDQKDGNTTLSKGFHQTSKNNSQVKFPGNLTNITFVENSSNSTATDDKSGMKKPHTSSFDDVRNDNDNDNGTKTTHTYHTNYKNMRNTDDEEHTLVNPFTSTDVGEDIEYDDGDGDNKDDDGDDGGDNIDDNEFDNQKDNEKKEEAKFEANFQNNVDRFVGHDVVQGKPYHSLMNHPEYHITRHHYGTDGHMFHKNPYETNRYHPEYHIPSREYETQGDTNHWGDMIDRKPLQIHLYNSTNTEDHLPVDHAIVDQHTFDHIDTQGESNLKPSAISNGHLAVTSEHDDSRNNEIHLYTGPSVHYVKPYNTSGIGRKTKQHIKNILKHDDKSNFANEVNPLTPNFSDGSHIIVNNGIDKAVEEGRVAMASLDDHSSNNPLLTDGDSTIKGVREHGEANMLKQGFDEQGDVKILVDSSTPAISNYLNEDINNYVPSCNNGHSYGCHYFFNKKKKQKHLH